MSNIIAEPKGLELSDRTTENGVEPEGSSKIQMMSDLTSYLGKLGLGDEHLAKVISLMEATGGTAVPLKLEDGISGNVDSHQPPNEPPAKTIVAIESDPNVGAATTVTDSPKSTGVTVFLAEEQQILLHAFKSFFENHEGVNLLGSSSDTSSEALIQATKDVCPKVMGLGVKALRPSTVEILEFLRDACPDLAIVLLFAFYDAKGIKALREYSRDVSFGRAYLLKHTIDTIDQLTHAISSVAQGRMIVDPTIMEELIKNGDSQSGMLRELSPRALEVLHWVSRGYRNETIAGVLSRDTQAVERQVSSIYAKMHLGEGKDARVGSALVYLKATGMLPRA